MGGWVVEGQKTTVSCALQIPLPSVRLRLTASSPAGGRSLWGWVLFAGTGNSMSLPCARGDRGKRVHSAHNAEGVSDPQSTIEASTDHG